VVELLVTLVLAWTLLTRWYLARWAARACAHRHDDPVAVLRDVPKWWWAAMDDCEVADSVVHACWGPP
jgi:hypothetical protein